MSLFDFYIEKIPNCDLLYKAVFVIRNNSTNNCDFLFSINIKKYHHGSCHFQFVSPNYRLSWNDDHQYDNTKFILGYTKNNEPIQFYTKEVENGIKQFFFKFDANQTECYSNLLQSYVSMVPKFIKTTTYQRNSRVGYEVNSISVIKSGQYKGYKAMYKSESDCGYKVTLDSIKIHNVTENNKHLKIGDNYLDGIIIDQIPTIYHIALENTTQIKELRSDQLLYVVCYTYGNKIEFGMVIKSSKTMHLIKPYKIECNDLSKINDCFVEISESIKNKTHKSLLLDAKYTIRKSKLLHEKWVIINDEIADNIGLFGPLIKKIPSFFKIHYTQYFMVSPNDIHFDKQNKELTGSNVIAKIDSKLCNVVVKEIVGPLIHIRDIPSLTKSCYTSLIHIDTGFVHDIQLPNGNTFHVLQIIDEDNYLGYEWGQFTQIKQVNRNNIVKSNLKFISRVKSVNEIDYTLNGFLMGPDGSFTDDIIKYKNDIENIQNIELNINEDTWNNVFNRLKKLLVQL
jgi:hypothetical protein